MVRKFSKILIFISVAIMAQFFVFGYASAGTLSCTVAASCSSGTTIFKMSGTDNAHAEISSQTNYSNLVCCTGVSGLGISCAGNSAVALKLSNTTNAHIEQNTQS